jgi:catechol 2,3-dioxygenase
MSSTSVHEPATEWGRVLFRPRRFGHVNMYVGDLEASYAFYHDLLGLEFAFDEPGLDAKFLSNGNSHHDLALMQSSARELVGRDGLVQKSSRIGASPGLNHLAFEMPTEALLVAAIRRGEEQGLKVHRYYDHLISRSVYLPDPDANELEIYSDSTPDWRELFESLGDQLLSARWTPEADGPPSEAHNYVDELDHRPVPGAPVQPLRTANATIVVADLERSVSFYESVVGLTELEADHGEGRWAILSGTLGLPDFMVLEASDGDTVGFHHFGLELPDAETVDAAAARLGSAGVTVERTVDHARKHSAVVLDPDGVPVELFARPAGSESVTFASVAAQVDRAFLL